MGGSTSSSHAADDNNDHGDKKHHDYDLKKTVVVLTGSQFINNLGFGCVIPVLPLFASDMGLGASGVGLILSTSAVARLCLNIPLGRLADRIGRKPLMVGGQIGTAVASLATGVCSTLPQLLACRLLLGAGSSAALSGSGAYMADITTRAPDQRAKIIGFQSTVINIAYAVGPAVGGYLCDLYGARLMFFIVGGAALITSAGFSSLPETYHGLKSANSDGGGNKNNADEAAAVLPRQASAWQV
jgi:MFS family permease